MRMTESQFAAAAYAVLLGIKANLHLDDENEKEAAQAIKDVLDVAPDTTRKNGRAVYGQVIESA